MVNRQSLSDDEIHLYMNFEEVLIKRKVALTKIKFLAGGSVLVIVFGLMMVWFWLQQMPNEKPVVDGARVMKRPAMETRDTEKNVESHKIPIVPERALTKEQVGILPNGSSEANNKKIVSTDQVYFPAEPIDGYDQLYSYFNSNIIYPSEAAKDSIQGTLTVNFTINNVGKPENIQISNSLGELFDKEARRLIEHMPVWKPATMNDKPISSRVSLPLSFVIKNN